jgi:hypothetical protein
MDFSIRIETERHSDPSHFKVYFDSEAAWLAVENQFVFVCLNRSIDDE